MMIKYTLAMFVWMVFDLLLLAEGNTPPINLDAAPWVGAGLLGAVLAWLLWKRLPDNDKQISDLITRHDKQTTDLIARSDERQDKASARHDSSVKDQRTDLMGVITGQQTMFINTLDRLERRSETQHAAVVGRLDQIGTQMGQVAERLKAIDDHVDKNTTPPTTTTTITAGGK